MMDEARNIAPVRDKATFMREAIAEKIKSKTSAVVPDELIYVDRTGIGGSKPKSQEPLSRIPEGSSPKGGSPSVGGYTLGQALGYAHAEELIGDARAKSAQTRRTPPKNQGRR
jgi:hypothetical protein